MIYSLHLRINIIFLLFLTYFLRYVSPLAVPYLLYNPCRIEAIYKPMVISQFKKKLLLKQEEFRATIRNKVNRPILSSSPQNTTNNYNNNNNNNTRYDSRNKNNYNNNNLRTNSTSLNQNKNNRTNVTNNNNYNNNKNNNYKNNNNNNRPSQNNPSKTTSIPSSSTSFPNNPSKIPNKLLALDEEESDDNDDSGGLDPIIDQMIIPLIQSKVILEESLVEEVEEEDLIEGETEEQRNKRLKKKIPNKSHKLPKKLTNENKNIPEIDLNNNNNNNNNNKKNIPEDVSSGRFKIKPSPKMMKDPRKDRSIFNEKDSFKPKRPKNKHQTHQISPTENSNQVLLPLVEQFIVKEASELSGVTSGEIIKYLMVNEGKLITINQYIDRETLIKVLQALGKEVIDNIEDEESLIKEEENNLIAEAAKIKRSPIVTIMGHVDHGKTSLLDAIRHTKIASQEAGGITQAISAFSVSTTFNNELTNITFIDTPGHAAFSEMRKRGTKITDIVVLVVAADDGVKEQTKECISAAKLADCPIVVAVNKIDKVTPLRVEIVKGEISQYDLMLEDYGGLIQCAEISAKNGTGIDDLLEKIMIQAEMMELKSDPNALLEATVIESSMEKGLGPAFWGIVQKGTIHVGDILVTGESYGKVKRIVNDRGESIKSLLPAIPGKIYGLNKVPFSGEKVISAPSELAARELSEGKLKYTRQSSGNSIHSNLANVAKGKLLDTRQLIKVPIILKADVAGSLEAIRNMLLNITRSNDEFICSLDIVYDGIGAITTSDINIAATSKAKLLAFNVESNSMALTEARKLNIDIQYFDVVYNLMDYVEDIILKSIAPPLSGILGGKALVKKVFPVGKSGKVAGCVIESGTIYKQGQVRILRNNFPVFTGTLSSLKIFKTDVDHVDEGNECGMGFTNFHDVQEGDNIEYFTTSEENNNDDE